MSKLASIGWSLSARGDCLRQQLTSMQEKHPVICDFTGELPGCDHNHADSFQNDLVILEKSGWIFTFWHGDAANPLLSVIQKNVIVQLLQGLFTIDMHFKKGVLSNSLLVNGVISEADFKKYFNKVYQAISGNAADEVMMREGWEIVADLICKFSICHRIGKRESKGIMPHILFPSLLPPFNNSDQTMWDNLNVKDKAKKGVTRKLIVAGKYGDKRKVMDFIFPRLMINMWNEVVDVKLCCQDKFVVRGDATPDDFSQEVGNIKNLMIVSRTDNEAISLERIGDCFGRMMQVEEEIERLFVEFRKCFGVILTRDQLKSRNFEAELECSECGMRIPPSSVPQTVDNLEEVCEWIVDQQDCEKCNKEYMAVETIENLSELPRVFYLLKKFGKSTNTPLERELGDFVNFPRNQITVADKQCRRFMEGKKLEHLTLQRKWQKSAKEAVFQCCFEVKEVMVSKYLRCRMVDYSLDAESSFETEQERKPFEEFLLEVKNNKSVYSSFAASAEQLKIRAKDTQCISPNLTIFILKFEELKKGMNSNFYNLFSKELREITKNLEKIASTWGKVKSVVEMMSRLCMLISRDNTMKISKTLRLQKNTLQAKKGVIFSEIALHRFDDVYVEHTSDGNILSKTVIVDLMNIFDGVFYYPPFSCYALREEIQSYGGEMQERLIFFLQISRGVEELKNLRIVHRNITLNNTVMHVRSNWVCLSASAFSMAIQCPTDAMILSPSEHKGLCGVTIAPPELQQSGAIKMDKFDVHSLGLILQELIDSFHIKYHDKREEKPEVIEFLQKVQERMVCEYEERMSIEEVIGVLEWMLYSDNHLAMYHFKGTSLRTAELWDCVSDQEILEKQERIMLAGIGQGSRFSMEEMMEIHFILSFTVEKKKQTSMYLEQLFEDLPAANHFYETLKEKYNFFHMRKLSDISPHQLEIKKVVGTGCNGIVWLVEMEVEGKRMQLALKMLFNFYENFFEKEEAESESNLLRAIKPHPNLALVVTKFTGVPTQRMLEDIPCREYLLDGEGNAKRTQFFLNEYYPFNLKEKLELLGRTLQWQEIHKYSRDLIRASLYLFKKGIVHRDVKLDNILVAQDGQAEYLLLADFGESLKADERHCVPLDKLKKGNALYRAPEVAKAIDNNLPVIEFSKQYSWEIACVIFEMIEGRFPFLYPVPEGVHK